MLNVFDDKKELFEVLANEFIAVATASIKAKGFFTVALTGGNSPAALYQLLASPAYRTRIDWSKAYVFWGDERWVPLNDPKSNATMAYDTLLNHVDIPKEHVYPMYADDQSPEEFAGTYERYITDLLGEDAKLDLILLGMGDDAHTASLFPGQEVLKTTDKKIDSFYLEEQSMYRITMTAPLINAAHHIFVLTFGQNKNAALNQVLHGEFQPMKYPLQLIKPIDGTLRFFVDREAAGK